MTNMEDIQQPDDTWGMGEAPGVADLLFEPAEQRFNDRSVLLGTDIPPDHHVVTDIGDCVVPADSVRLRARRKTKTYAVRAINEAGDHKKEIAAVLTVAGILLATQKLRRTRIK
jgi:hypothetical protein